MGIFCDADLGMRNNQFVIDFSVLFFFTEIHSYHPAIKTFCIFAEKKMKKLQTQAHLFDSSLKEMMHSQTDIHAFKDWQIIYTVQTNPGKQSK
jgi:hypothetical protein